MVLHALYGEVLRYLYVVSTVSARAAITRGSLAALAGTFALAAWRLRAGASRARRATSPGRENA